MRTAHEYRIGIVGTKFTTLDLLADLEKSDHRVSHIITLPRSIATRNCVSGYVDLRGYAGEKSLQLHLARTYALSDAEDQHAISQWKLDVLLVIGWERLIPETILASLTSGAFGMHGSPWGLPRGRGRSPMNWALITGEKQFRTHLFKLDASVDGGQFVDCIEFEILPFDTIETLHFKNRVAMFRLLQRHMDSIMRGRLTLQEQSVTPTFFPKRAPDDGAVDWECSADEVYNLVRALTHPYPGAFTYLGPRRLNLWNAQPLGRLGDYRSARPGEVVETGASGPFAVRCGSGTLLVTRWEWADRINSVPPQRGDSLRSVSAIETLRAIVNRYPPGVEEHQKEIRLR